MESCSTKKNSENDEKVNSIITSTSTNISTLNSNDISTNVTEFQAESEYHTISTLGYDKENVILIESSNKNIKQLEECFEEISSADIIGLDSEWVKGKGQIKTVVFQLATRKKAYVFDFQPQIIHKNSNYGVKGDETFDKTFENLMSNVFKDENILKVAWDFDLDLKNLNNKFPKNNKLTELRNFVDLMRIGPKYIEKGFSNHCYFYLGKKLDKTNQNCEWDKRPFTEDKIIYAAIDAIAAIPLYDKMLSSQNNLEKSNQNSEISISKPWVLDLNSVNKRMKEWAMKKQQMWEFNSFNIDNYI